MDPRLLIKLNTERTGRRPVIYLTDLAGGPDRVLAKGDTVSGPLGVAVAEAFRSGKSRIVATDDGEVFLNVHLPPPRIVVIGAVHISQALAPMAAIAGFDVTIIDPRTAFASPERFAGVDLVADWPEDVLAARPLDPFTALVAITHDPKIDDFALRAALQAGCFYVGALGSRKTHGRRVERLRAEGVGETAIAGISAPIGLDIGAASPAEIAVAILAEIIAALRRREPDRRSEAA